MDKKRIRIIFLSLIILTILCSYMTNEVTAATGAIYPVADTFVDEWGAWAQGDTLTFPPQVVNWVGTDESVPSTDARSAIKFDLSSIIGIVTHAQLGIHVVEAYGNISLNIYKSSVDWFENTSTIPAYDTPPIWSTSITPIDNDSWKYYDVTNFVCAQITGNKLATFVLTGNTSGINQFAYNSREDSSNPPKLSIDYISSAFSPLDDAVNVGINDNLVITFSSNVMVGTGNITIKEALTNNTVETIDVTGGKVTGSGTNKITINPATTLAGETGYYILIDSTAFRDSNGHYFSGISDKTKWNFTTADVTAPTINTLSPADNALNVGVNDNLILTFNENVVVGTGNITIKKSSDDSVVEMINVTGPKVTGSGSTTITVNPATTLAGETDYYVLIAATAFYDMSGNSYAGISGKTAWNFTTADVSPPTVNLLSPADNAVNVGVNTNLEITFNEKVVVGTGNITIRKTSDDSVVETIDVTGAKVTGGGTATITINPATTLAEETGYYVLIDPTAFDDTAGNSFAGISDKTAWNFTTEDVTPPTVNFLSPADNAVNVPVNANLVITFNENVVVKTGNITIKKTTDDSTVETISVTSGKVTGSGTGTITINPDNIFTGSTGYYILIDPTAFDDLAGNSYAGISNKSEWNFTTVAPTPPTITFLKPVNLSTVNISDGSTIIVDITDNGTGVNPGDVQIKIDNGAWVQPTSLAATAYGYRLYYVITSINYAIDPHTVTVKVTYSGGLTITEAVTFNMKVERKGFGFGKLRFD